jgi:hypothetical protein
MVAALIAAQQWYLTIFTMTAPDPIVRAYTQRTADPAFTEVTRLEHIALAGASSGTLGVDASAWLDSVTAKLERLREVGEVQAAAIRSRAAAR